MFNHFQNLYPIFNSQRHKVNISILNMTTIIYCQAYHIGWENSIPPFLHLKEQTARLISAIMSGMQPDHHIVYIITSTIILLMFHPAEYSIAMLQWSPLR